MDDHDSVFATFLRAQRFTPPELPTEPPSREALAAADRTSRQWTSSQAGPLPIGSEAHKREACRMFLETFNPYRPSVIAWPKLSPEMLERVTSLPIWDIAVHTESRARLRFASYANAVADPDIARAVMLNAWEESRHKEVIATLVATYGISLAAEPPFKPPRDPQWAYLLTGHQECVDSFFAFGLFELARRSGYFGTELVETFEPVIQEECRHILLFANLVAWERANLPWWRRIGFELRILGVWAYIAWERMVMARSLSPKGHGAGQDTNFTATTAKSMGAVELDARDLIEISLKENDRRFAGYDPRLVRPTLVPKLARFALRFIKSRKPRPPAETGRLESDPQNL
jgi:hypothetical protein